MTYELVIKNGRVIDGTGNPWFRADVGIRDGKIAKMGRIEDRNAGRILDAEGKAVCPGFIDLHNHSDITALAIPTCESNLMQGVTTAVVGNCGLSMAPADPKTIDLLKEYLAPFLVGGFDYPWDWKSLADFTDRLDRTKIAVNLAPLIGHGTLRIAVSGFKKEPLSADEMADMKRLLSESLTQGAYGMSSGLIYPPGCYADAQELIALGAVLKSHGRIYASHIRDEGSGLIASVEEAIRVGEENHIHVQISHHKAKGANNWGKVKQTLEIMAQARRRGVDVSCEAYPYVAGSTTITSILPTWVLEGGVDQMLGRLRQNDTRERILRDFTHKENDIKEAGWDGILIASCPPHPAYEGQSLEKILTEKTGSDPTYPAFLDLVLDIRGDSTVVKFFMDEADVKTVLASPLASVISDSWSTSPAAGGKPHPRTYGTFPRVLGKYVREEHLVTLEEAVRKMTSLPASQIGIYDRGILKEGLWADVVVFDPETIADRATFDAPHRYPVGIEYIIVNGDITVEGGEPTGSRAGRVLRAG